MSLIQYESIREFEKALPERGHHGHEYERKTWSGNMTYNECRQAVYTGDAKALEKSDKILEKVEAEGIELLSPAWEYGRAGAIPCVPSFLAGEPESMRRLDMVASEIAPIRIYLDLFISCAFTADQLIKRGAMLLALARKLQAIRPVEMWLLMSSSKTYDRKTVISPLIKLETNPLDLTTASFVLGHPGFVRQLTFAWHVAHDVPSVIPFVEAEDVIKVVKPTEHDLFIHNAVFTYDVLDNPVQWVNEQVKKYARTVEESLD